MLLLHPQRAREISYIHVSVFINFHIEGAYDHLSHQQGHHRHIVAMTLGGFEAVCRV